MTAAINSTGAGKRGYPAPVEFIAAVIAYYVHPVNIQTRSEERFSRNAETDLVCRLLLEKKKPRGLPSPRLPLRAPLASPPPLHRRIFRSLRTLLRALGEV